MSANVDVAFTPDKSPTANVGGSPIAPFGPVSVKADTDKFVIYAKQAFGALSASDKSVQGVLLASGRFDFNHDATFNARKVDSAYGRYLDARLQGKRVDTFVGRSGSILVVVTPNPFVKFNTGTTPEECAANYAAAMRDPTSSVYAMNDIVDVDLGKRLIEAGASFTKKRLVAPNSPLDYTCSGSWYVLLAQPPSSGNVFNMSLFFTAKVEVSGYINSALALKSYMKMPVVLPADPNPVIRENGGDYKLEEVMNITSGWIGTGSFVLDHPNPFNIVVKDDDPIAGAEEMTESHIVYNTPIEAYGQDGEIMFIEFPTSIGVRTNFNKPKYVSGMPASLTGHIITVVDATTTSFDGHPLSLMPVGVANSTLEQTFYNTPAYVRDSYREHRRRQRQ